MPHFCGFTNAQCQKHCGEKNICLLAEATVGITNPKQRYGDLKLPLALVPSSALIYLGIALAEGARKYGPFNWREKKVEAMTYAHAALRHLFAWIDGEEIDPESGNPHLAHALACLGILADAVECKILIDNRPLKGPAARLLKAFAEARKVA